MSGAIFEQIRQRVPAIEAARLYGLEPNRSNMLCCPFHGDRTPSLHFYKGRYHCFGCGAGGDATDFTARLFGLTPLEAAKKLNADFNLGLDLDGPPPDPAEQARRQEMKRLYARFEAWREQAIRDLSACYRLGLDPLEGNPVAVRFHELIGDYLDHLTGTPAQQIELYALRGGVAQLTQQILNSSPKP